MNKYLRIIFILTITLDNTILIVCFTEFIKIKKIIYIKNCMSKFAVLLYNKCYADKQEFPKYLLKIFQISNQINIFFILISIVIC